MQIVQQSTWHVHQSSCYLSTISEIVPGITCITAAIETIGLLIFREAAGRAGQGRADDHDDMAS